MIDAARPTLADPEVQAFLGEVLERKNIVFVTGCGRSGTKLLQRCLSTLRECVYYAGENDLTAIFEQRRLDGRNLVVKRRAASYQTVDLIPAQVKVVQIVRDPANVFTSRVRTRRGYYIQPDRWIAEHLAFKKLAVQHPAENLSVVRFEDLVRDADAVQAELTKTLGLDFDLPFSRHTERNALDTQVDKVTREARIWQPIDPDLWRRSRDDGEGGRRLAELGEVLGPYLREFQVMFGYGDEAPGNRSTSAALSWRGGLPE